MASLIFTRSAWKRSSIIPATTLTWLPSEIFPTPTSNQARAWLFLAERDNTPTGASPKSPAKTLPLLSTSVLAPVPKAMTACLER